jgi:hypothetical protein
MLLCELLAVITVLLQLLVVLHLVVASPLLTNCCIGRQKVAQQMLASDKSVYIYAVQSLIRISAENMPFSVNWAVVRCEAHLDRVQRRLPTEVKHEEGCNCIIAH